ncbi:MAG: MopE-related protein [Patescibacteria group bacterium]|nr:MopE-related protein [Patescibacteria group bacterium]
MYSAEIKNNNYFLKIVFVFVLCLLFLCVGASNKIKADSSDVIAVRVIMNSDHLSAHEWYKMQNFTGSPQLITVDAYRGVRDGRTVYVNVANIAPSGGVDTLFTNIYIISYNQSAENTTKDIFGLIIDKWQFNSNLEFRGNCRINNSEVCLNDSDCPAGDVCGSVKSRVTRDVRRLEDNYVMTKWLIDYEDNNGHFPKLSAGSYLPNISLSVWPSWQDTLAADLGHQLRLDPVNKLGACPLFNEITCWNEEDQSFADPSDNGQLDLPNDSLVYVYIGDDEGTTGLMTTNFEQPFPIYNPPSGTPMSTCLDFDGDGYGSPGNASCTYPETDCNDNNASVWQSSGPEICFGGDDEDCDGMIDCADTIDCGTDPVCLATFCDGVCNTFCSNPACTVIQDPDCGCQNGDGCCGNGCVFADDDDCTAPCSDFICDGTCGDNCTEAEDPDCGCGDDGACCGEGCTFPTDPDCPQVCVDNDGDGVDGYDAINCPGGTDCDDTVAGLNGIPGVNIFPGQAENCDGVDNDCDGSIDEDFTNQDDCEYVCLFTWTGAGGENACCGDDSGEAGPYLLSENTTHPSCPGSGDCCGDGLDNDCDGSPDNLDPDCSTVCTDSGEDDFDAGVGDCNQCDLVGDQDGNQDHATTFQSWDVVCPTYNDRADDCDIACNPLIGHGVTVTADQFEPVETICDGIDNDCDGVVDEGCGSSCCTFGTSNFGCSLCDSGGPPPPPPPPSPL